MSRTLGEQIRDQAVKHWHANKGDNTHSLDHEHLNKESLVIDFGGYTGEWAQQIFDRYGCFIEIYEPGSSFAQEIKERFKDHLGSKIIVKEVAVGLFDGKANMFIAGPASIVKKSDEGQVQVVSAASIFSNRKVDLLKMNIEGGEYDAFESLFRNNLISNITSILVQFHPVDDMSIEKYNAIASQLSKTHQCVFRYPFIWEKWDLRNI